MTQDEIIAKVRSIMNEAGSDQVLSLLNDDSVKLDEYIKSCIPDAVNIVSANSKFTCVNKKSKSLTASEIKDNKDGSGYIILPSDYVSLIALKMNGWGRIVTHAEKDESEIALAQHNKNTRAGKQKPICVLTNNADGRVIEYYSVDGTPSVSLFLYEAAYSGVITGGCSEPISSAVCYMCASLVYSIFENKETSSEMKLISLGLIPKE